MRAGEVGTFSDVLFYLEHKGVEKDEARDIVTRVFGWGVEAAMVRMRQPSPVPADAPKAEAVPAGQLSLIDAPGRRKPPAPRKVPHSFPESFTLEEDMRLFARDRGFDPPSIERMWERFRDRNQARGEMYADWKAAWRTWVNNQVEFRRRDQRDPDRTPDGRL